MASNLPPGVTDDQIPGNRPEDAELEALHEEIDDEIMIARLTARQARIVWDMGLAAWNALKGDPEDRADRLVAIKAGLGLEIDDVS